MPVVIQKFKCETIWNTVLVIKLSVTVLDEALVRINLLMKIKGQTAQGVLQECLIVCLFYFGFN